MIVVLYHKDCNDGFFAAKVVHEYHGADALYIPVDYKSMQDRSCKDGLKYIFSEEYLEKVKANGNSKLELFNITEKDYKDISLIVVDFSFSLEDFKEHCELFKTVLVIDHHETAFKNYSKNFVFNKNELNVTRKDGSVLPETFYTANSTSNSVIYLAEKMSGAKLAYLIYKGHLLTNTSSKGFPLHIELVSDRDLWTFNYPETNHFFYGMRLLDSQNFNEVNRQIELNFDNILLMGKLYENMIKNRVAKLRASAVNHIQIVMNGETYSCGIINGNSDIASDICNDVIYKDDYDISFTYSILKDYDVSCSVRSNKEVNCLPLAEHFGGGGHKTACGFHMSLATLGEILETESLVI